MQLRTNRSRHHDGWPARIVILATLILSACASGNRQGSTGVGASLGGLWSNLVPRATNGQLVVFTEPMLSSLARPLTLVTQDGTVISQSVAGNGPIQFVLPAAREYTKYTTQCLRVQSANGQIASIAGVSGNAFVLPDWQALMAQRFEVPSLASEQWQLKSRIASDNNELRVAAGWLRSHSAEYASGCPEPALRPRPGGTCASDDEAQTIARQSCEHEYACPAMGWAAGQAAGQDYAALAEFMVSNGCVAKVMQARGQEFFTMENMLSLGFDMFWEAALTSTLEASGMPHDKAALGAKGIMIFKAYQQCSQSTADACRGDYRKWLDEPRAAQLYCRKAAGAVTDLPAQIARNEARLREVEARLAQLRSAVYSRQSGSGARLAACS